MSVGLLMDEPPLVVQPGLAKVIGLNEAIVLQQVHYWLQENKRKKQNFINGRYWTYNSIPKWLEQFPFWSDAGLRKIVGRLKQLGVLETAQLSKDSRDRTLYYTINYEALHLLLEDKSICYAVADASTGSVADVYKETETTTETTTETKEEAPVLPEWLNIDAWSEWLTYNREHGRTLKPSSIKVQLSKLQTLSKDEPQTLIIQRAIERQWRSFFPDRAGTYAYSGRGVKNSARNGYDAEGRDIIAEKHRRDREEWAKQGVRLDA